MAQGTSSLRGDSTRADAGGARAQEVRARLTSIKVGVWLSVIVCVGGALYAVAQWDRPNRVAILAVIALGLVTAPLVRALPLGRILRNRHSELFFVAWSVADIALIATIAGLDGGSQSGYMLLLILPFLFAALSYPPRTILAVAVSEIADTLGIDVIAEVVETDEQVRAANALGCGYAQGFHFAEPVPASRVERLREQPMPAFR